MQFYPAGETITRRLLDLPLEHTEWIITGAEAGDIIAAGFLRHQADETRFVHAESGDIYQLARHQYVDERADRLRYQCDHGVTLENELATRALTILAMASDGENIIDPFDGLDDLINGVLRHVTPQFVHVPQNLLTVAVWAARLAAWGFSTAHETHGLMKKMVACGAIDNIPQDTISEAVLKAISTPRPSEFFRALRRCNALRAISKELDVLFEGCNKSEGRSKRHHTEHCMPDVMQALDKAAARTDNISSIIKEFYQGLGDRADRVFNALGLEALT
jgi:tRNA nucleotidyltransferase (CCA-adding enzyme)